MKKRGTPISGHLHILKGPSFIAVSSHPSYHEDPAILPRGPPGARRAADPWVFEKWPRGGAPLRSWSSTALAVDQGRDRTTKHGGNCQKWRPTID